METFSAYVARARLAAQRLKARCNFAQIKSKAFFAPDIIPHWHRERYDEEREHISTEGIVRDIIYILVTVPLYMIAHVFVVVGMIYLIVFMLRLSFVLVMSDVVVALGVGGSLLWMHWDASWGSLLKGLLLRPFQSYET